jgi:hypothetical protein
VDLDLDPGKIKRKNEGKNKERKNVIFCRLSNGT